MASQEAAGTTLDVGAPVRVPRGLLLAAFGFSGAASLIFEVAWTRTLSTVMGSSSYAMSTVLAAFLTGLAVGALWGTGYAKRASNLTVAFALCELGIGVTGLFINPLIKSLTPVYISAYYAFHMSFVAFSAVQFVIAFAVMGIPTTLMGVGFPLVVRSLTRNGREEAVEAARAYSLNTFGAVLGSLLAGFLLIPLVGTSRAAMIAAAVNVVTALVILLMDRQRRLAAGAVALTLAALGGASLLRPLPVPFFSFASASRFGNATMAFQVASALEREGERAVIFHREGVEGEVSLTSHEISGRAERTLINNGKLESGDLPEFQLLAFLPYFTHTWLGPTHKVLNIGLGSGNTLRSLAKLPVEAIESVELSDGVLEANRRFLNPGLFSDPRIHHTLADGRNFLMLTRERYDLIVVSPSWAIELASAGMLTDEFFQLAHDRLAPQGVISVWVDFSMLSDEDMSLLLRTFAKSFQHVSAWRVGGDEVVLVGSNADEFPPEAQVAERIATSEPSLKGLFDVALSDRAARPPSFDEVNTDDRPRLEFSNARAFVRGGPESAPRAP